MTRLPADTGTCGGAMATLPFTDVSSNFFFCQIAEAYFSGLTNGTTPTTYSPNDFVRRDQMAAFTTRTQDSALSGAAAERRSDSGVSNLRTADGQNDVVGDVLPAPAAAAQVAIGDL
jgi:hypothetical protein